MLAKFEGAVVSKFEDVINVYYWRSFSLARAVCPDLWSPIENGVEPRLTAILDALVFTLQDEVGHYSHLYLSSDLQAPRLDTSWRPLTITRLIGQIWARTYIDRRVEDPILAVFSRMAESIRTICFNVDLAVQLEVLLDC